MKGNDMRKANPGTHQICRSLLQKAVRRGHSQLARHVATHLKDNSDTAWLRGRIAVIAFEECWPLAAKIRAKMSLEELLDVLGQVAVAAKIKDAAGLGSLAYALSTGDRSTLSGLLDDRPVRLVAGAIERPKDFWSWIEEQPMDASEKTLVESARRSYGHGGWPWDRAFMLAAAYLAVSEGTPEPPQGKASIGEFPYWVALDKHTSRGCEVLRAVARQAGLPWQQVFWCSFYFESAWVNDDRSVAWWRREADWRLGKTGLAYDQARELWHSLGPRVAESLTDDAARLRSHLGVEDLLIGNKESQSAVSHQLALF